MPSSLVILILEQLSKEKLTMDKEHDGKPSTLIATCDLNHPLAMQHPERRFPAYCFIGKNKIHYILVMPQLWEAVLRSGSLPLYSLSRLTLDPTMLTLMLYWLLLIMPMK